MSFHKNCHLNPAPARHRDWRRHSCRERIQGGEGPVGRQLKNRTVSPVCSALISGAIEAAIAGLYQPGVGTFAGVATDIERNQGRDGSVRHGLKRRATHVRAADGGRAVETAVPALYQPAQGISAIGIAKCDQRCERAIGGQLKHSAGAVAAAIVGGAVKIPVQNLDQPGTRACAIGTVE
jgi:hypothetical protein